MNPGNFQNMAGLRGGNPGPQQQQNGVQGNNGLVHLQQHLFRMIQQQQIPQGWQTAVTVQNRAGAVWQLVTLLRLIKPEMNIPQIIHIALNFEKKVFYEMPDKQSYEHACREKLSSISATRSRQASNIQQQIQNPQPQQMNVMQQHLPMQGVMQNQGQGQDQFQQGFPNSQLQHPMQATMMPMQTQLSQQGQQVSMGNSMPAPHAVMQQMPQNTQPPTHSQPMFTPEENAQVTRMAQKLAQNTPKEDLDRIRNNLQALPLAQRQSFMMQDVDPLTFYFRNQAGKQFAAQRARLRDATTPRQVHGVAPQGNASLPHQQRPSSQNSMRTQNQQSGVVPVTQTFDSSFLGNVDQILGQQQDALRSQEAGQVVVPASNSQGMTEQQRGSTRGTPRQQLNGQPGAARPVQNPNTMHQQQQQQVFNTPQIQQENISQAARMQGHSQGQPFANMSTPNQQQVALQGQLGGLNSLTGQRPPQQTPTMPNLNRPIGQNLPQTSAQGVTQQWPQQRTPQMGHPNGQDPLEVQQNTLQQQRLSGQPGVNQQRTRPQMGMTPQVQQALAQMTEEQRRGFIAQVHQKQQELRAGQAEATQGARSQSGQQPGIQHAQVMTSRPGIGQTSTAAPQTTSMSQQPSNANASNPQSMQQHSSQQQQEVLRNQRMAQQKAVQMAAVSLTEEQARQMDRYNFPSGILNATSSYSQMPENVKTWGQLKAWVQHHAHTLPPESLDKLRGLQGLHYQNLAIQHRARIQNQHREQNLQGQTNMQSLPQAGPAPPAQMVQSHAGQQPAAISGSHPMQVPGFGLLQSLPQPTVQELQATRARLPENMREVSDDQIRSMILQRRQEEISKAAQGQQNTSRPSTLPNANMQRNQQLQATQQRSQPPVTHNAQLHQSQPMQARQLSQQKSKPTIGPSIDAGARQVQQDRTVPQNQAPAQIKKKGMKRNSNDDVVEVPNPNLAKSQPRAQAPNTSHPAAQVPGMQQSNAQQHDNMSHEQRAVFETQLRNQANQKIQTTTTQAPVQESKGSGPTVSEGLRAEDQGQRNAILKRLHEEAIKMTPPRNPMQMNQETRNKMIKILSDAKAMIVRMEKTLPMFFDLLPNEKVTRDMISIQLLICQQYRDAQYNPADQFTISLEELEHCKSKMTQYFQFIMNRHFQKQKNGQAQQNSNQPAQQSTQPQPPQLNQGQRSQLNAANLQQQQQALQSARQAGIHKNHNNRDNRDNRAPAAPTSAQPPFQLGAQSPHGIPHAYGPNEVTQDKLKLPPAKKRKNNQPVSAASTPLQAHATPTSDPSPQVSKISSPEIQRMHNATSLTKCPMPGCEASKLSFASQADLAKHTAEVHEPKEAPINDPLEFALESIRIALNLDENGKMKAPKDTNAGRPLLEAPMMKTSASAQSHTPMKMETSTPMTRAPTQTGPSPASNMLKTPQPVTNVKTPQPMVNIKTPASDVKLAAKDVKSISAKPSPAPIKDAATPPRDLWADSSISPACLSRCFSSLIELQSAGPWSKVQSSLTPESTLSSGKSEKNSPRQSDISENDVLKIELDGEGWMPSEWFEDGLFGGMEQLNVEDEIMALSWDDAFGKVDEVVEGKGKKRRDEWAAGAAWDPTLWSVKL